MLIAIPTNVYQIVQEAMSTCLMARQFALIYVLLDFSWKIVLKDASQSVQLDLLNQLLGTVFKDVLEMFRLLGKIRYATTHA